MQAVFAAVFQGRGLGGGGRGWQRLSVGWEQRRGRQVLAQGKQPQAQGGRKVAAAGLNVPNDRFADIQKQGQFRLAKTEIKAKGPIAVLVEIRRRTMRLS